jgi:uncharacterized protein (DUF433 family)
MHKRKSRVTDVMVNPRKVKPGGGTQQVGTASIRHCPAREGENTSPRPYISAMNPELLTEIAIRAFARATKEAIAENDRLGIPSYGSKDGQIVVRQTAMTTKRAMIDWSQCPDAESIPGKMSGAWCLKGTRIRCDDITGQFDAGCSAEEIAGPDIYPELSVDVVRRILAFAGVDPDTPPLFGEDWLSALLLAMLIDHCTGHSPEKERQLQTGQATYLSPDPSPGEWLNSYNSPANAAAMRELEGYLEIVEQDGARILAKLTPEGRALLDQLQADRERDREREASRD